ncbi:MAG: acetyl-CoA carboxylase biotin carboxyl carrier protein [Planctomycetaceae bacterium]|nr:acetyl-CoA carboxylase biotin carboxyl carrier protein [Planctomycetaceae bacterium]
MAISKDSPNNDVFDVHRVRQLVELMNEYNLAEVDLQKGDMRIQLKANVAPSFSAMPVPQHIQPAVPLVQPVVAPAVPTTSAPVAVTNDQSNNDANMVFIKSPMVGTFYAAKNPESPAFVKVGDTVGPETTVCILEAMKVFNEIQAECSGKVVAVLAKNGDPIDFGKPLFKIDSRG